MPPEIGRDFPLEPRDLQTGRLSRIRGVPLAEHLRRLERSREVFLKEVKRFSPSFGIPRGRTPKHGSFEATPEWMLFHLIAS